MKKPETIFRERKVIPFLKTLKNTSYFPIQQMAIHGTPDLLLCSFGVFVALELKAEDGKPSKLQQNNLDWVEKTRGVALVASPNNWERVKNSLRKLDQGEFD